MPGTYTVPEDTSTIPEPFRYVGCVQTGPFRQGVYTAHLGPGKLVTDHCLVRGVNETWKPMMRSGEIEKQVASTDFETFRIVIDDFTNGIHGIGHAGVGGEMTNFWSAPAGKWRLGIPRLQKLTDVDRNPRSPFLPPSLEPG